MSMTTNGASDIYRPGNGNIDISKDIDPFFCTHLVYAFVGLKNNSVKVLDPWGDLPPNYPGGGLNGFGKFNELRKKNPYLKTLVAIGGWNEGSTQYSNMAKNAKYRKHFAADAANFVVKHGFDGMSLDWEYPAQNGGAPEDVVNYIKLLKILRTHFNKKNLILSAAVAPTESSASISYNISQMVEYLDYVNLMTYDLHTSHEKKTNLHAPLYPGDDEPQDHKQANAKASVEYWLSQGCPKNKLILGIPLYGRSLTLCDPTKTFIGADACGPGEGGPYTREPGLLGLNEICELIDSTLWKDHYERDRIFHYMSYQSQWISYEGLSSIEEKGRFINKLDLGGAMVYSIDIDNIKGNCGIRYPLLTTLNNTIRN
ncbi:hypothetical protein PV325_007399 [Microctonus aethiopoides]|uniref:GH18 domain-containing protein n=1 Tax=Microctonus aethiopoides TaxID=144406 RepID=A0AA39C5E9_9HYME|nr:hypothetical protein PV325_007399 [Microctonus aethiopoides]KAK0157939.1 hypothetical protein PV328_011623 [Microctonus aethiopoides]